jgi:hypothetical protein
MSSTLTERIALSILDREGIAAIWPLHVAAAEAHRTGHPAAAAAILEVAEAAEKAWISATERVMANGDRARQVDGFNRLPWRGSRSPTFNLIRQPLEPRSHHKQTGPNFWKPGATRQSPHFGGSAQISLGPCLFVGHRRLTRTLPSCPDGPGGGLALMSPRETAIPGTSFPAREASTLTLGFRGPVSASASYSLASPSN